MNKTLDFVFGISIQNKEEAEHFHSEMVWQICIRRRLILQLYDDFPMTIDTFVGLGLSRDLEVVWIKGYCLLGVESAVRAEVELGQEILSEL